tara:strand:+ start:155 stop:958 length:804 start_codon:yes stop_codon:yes gene_type:complete
MAQQVVLGGPSHARGLAVLCGWGGSSLKNVLKYSTLWHKLGWRTATAAMSLDQTFYPASWTIMDEVSAELAATCRTHRAARSDALVAAHAFSNGGTFLMLSVLAAANDSEIFDGVVYDSCPSRPSTAPWLAAGAPLVIATSGLSSSSMGLQLLRHVPYAIVATLAMPLRPLPPPLGRWPQLFSADANPPRRELMVYGDEDALIPAAHVEAFVRLRESQGSTVRTLLCTGSPHVSHLRTNPSQYAHAIEEFVTALEGPAASTQLVSKL